MKRELQNTRKDYHYDSLNEVDLASDPLQQFQRWYRDYQSVTDADPNAMILSTAKEGGRVSARVLLLKGIEEKTFEFYSNYASRKGQELAENPWASLTFYWPELERQVRVEGKVVRMSEAASEAYFKSRPYGSQIAAWVSPQSEEISDRYFLELREEEIRARFPIEVDKPPYWGGYRLHPDLIEFWQGRPNRLHDRLEYRKEKEEGWRVVRLAP